MSKKNLSMIISALILILTIPGFTADKTSQKVFISKYLIDEQEMVAPAPLDFKPDAKKIIFGQERKTFTGHISDVVAADFNGDGFTDIAVLDSGDDIRIYMGNASASFNQVFIKKFSDAGSDFSDPVDYTGDGKPDIAISNSSDDKHLTLFPGKGNGKLGKGKSVPLTEDYDYFAPQIYYIQSFNFDGDKRTDIIGFRSTGDIIVFKNIGKGKFKTTIHESKRVMCWSMAAADFTGDNKDDFFVYHFTSGDIRFYRNNGNETFTKVYDIEVDDSVSALYSADLNKDGKPDFIRDGHWNFAGFNVTWERAITMLGKGNGTLVKKKKFPDDGRLTYGATFGDFNGDNKVDIAAASYDGINVYPGKGTGKLKKSTHLAEGLSITPGGSRIWGNNIASGDFNGDGKRDIVGAQFFRGPNKTYIANLMIFINGGKPSSLTITNLVVDTLSYNSTTKKVTFKGSFNYSGRNIDMRYNQNGLHPTDSSFLGFKLTMDSSADLTQEYEAIYYATGEFLHHPGQSSGKIDFDFELNIDKTIYSTIQDLTITDFALYDYELVKSNELECSIK